MASLQSVRANLVAEFNKPYTTSIDLSVVQQSTSKLNVVFDNARSAVGTHTGMLGRINKAIGALLTYLRSSWRHHQAEQQGVIDTLESEPVKVDLFKTESYGRLSDQVDDLHSLSRTLESSADHMRHVSTAIVAR